LITVNVAYLVSKASCMYATKGAVVPFLLIHRM